MQLGEVRIVMWVSAHLIIPGMCGIRDDGGTQIFLGYGLNSKDGNLRTQKKKDTLPSMHEMGTNGFKE
jgi:hypothetical protein